MIMSSSIIDWNGALEQCGGDEEFLTELLGDFNTELDTQMRKIEAELNKGVDFGPESTVAIQRAAHVVKGAAGNLMCQDLRESATKLEAAAKSGMEKQILIESYNTLSVAIANFRIVAAKGM